MTRFAKQGRFGGAAVVALPAIALLAVALLATAAGNAFAEDAAPAQTAPPPSAPAAPSPPAAPTAAAPAVPPQSASAERPGFLHQLKVWWDGSIAVFDNKSKDTHGGVDDPDKKPDDDAKGATNAAKSAVTATQDAMKNAVEATKGAATTATDAMKGAVEATKGAASTATDAMKGAVEVTKNAATAIARLPGTRVVDVHETCARAPNGAPDCAAAAANGCRGKGFNTGNPVDVRTAEKCDTKPLQGGNLAKPLACGTETVVIRAVCQ
jgi:hypothetical protein